MDKKKVLTVTILIITVILTLAAIIIAFKLYQLSKNPKESSRPSPVANNKKEVGEEFLANPNPCQLNFTVTGSSLSPSPSSSPGSPSPSPSPSENVSPSPSPSPSSSLSPSPSQTPNSPSPSSAAPSSEAAGGITPASPLEQKPAINLPQAGNVSSTVYLISGGIILILIGLII